MTSKQQSAFTTSQNKGVQFTFANGWTLSIQWGPSNYCDHNTIPIILTSYDWRQRPETWSSTTAEIAAWNSKGRWWSWSDNKLCASSEEVEADLEKDDPEYPMTSDVKGHCTISEVVDAINLISGMPKE